MERTNRVITTARGKKLIDDHMLRRSQLVPVVCCRKMSAYTYRVATIRFAPFIPGSKNQDPGAQDWPLNGPPCSVASSARRCCAARQRNLATEILLRGAPRMSHDSRGAPLLPETTGSKRRSRQSWCRLPRHLRSEGSGDSATGEPHPARPAPAADARTFLQAAAPNHPWR